MSVHGTVAAACNLRGTTRDLELQQQTVAGLVDHVVSTAAAGTISVQLLPARWNLCGVQPLVDLQASRPRDRVEVVGTVTAPGELVVCEQPQHRLRKTD